MSSPLRGLAASCTARIGGHPNGSWTELRSAAPCDGMPDAPLGGAVLLTRYLGLGWWFAVV